METFKDFAQVIPSDLRKQAPAAGIGILELTWAVKTASPIDAVINYAPDSKKAPESVHVPAGTIGKIEWASELGDRRNLSNRFEQETFVLERNNFCAGN